MKVGGIAAAPLTPQSVSVFGRAALQDILAERIAQIDEHGFTLEHDLGHAPGELAEAAEAYLQTAIDQLRGAVLLPQLAPRAWPWERQAWRPGDARANLIKAAAIVWALVDRIDGPADPAASEAA